MTPDCFNLLDESRQVVNTPVPPSVISIIWYCTGQMVGIQCLCDG